MTLIPTDRLRLLPPSHTTANTIQTMVKWLNDPDVVRYSEQRHKKHDAESQAHYVVETDLFREIHIRDYPDGEANRKFIGTITASIDAPNSVADIGILIGAKEEWGKGYGTEAWTGFIEHLLNHGIRKVEAGCMSINIGMKNVCRKSGMVYEGRRLSHFLLVKNDHLRSELCDMDLWGKF
jgi:ribosomal-protein-alanine N-acetyltransferase